MKVEYKRFGFPYNPQKENKTKNKLIRHIVLFLIIFIAVTLVLTLGVEALIRLSVAQLSVNNEMNATWIGSVASYWGGIIGGMISGILAFIGVFYTIRYYKESDEQKEKASIQPFLHVTVASGSGAMRGFSLGKLSEDKKEQKQVNVNIKNIGNGFANTLVVHTGANFGGLAFNNVIAVGESVNLFFVVDKNELNKGVHFCIRYIDSMRNEYIQEYDMKMGYNSVRIECGYPAFLEQF